MANDPMDESGRKERFMFWDGQDEKAYYMALHQHLPLSIQKYPQAQRVYDLDLNSGCKLASGAYMFSVVCECGIQLRLHLRVESGLESIGPGSNRVLYVTPQIKEDEEDQDGQ